MKPRKFTRNIKDPKAFFNSLEIGEVFTYPFHTMTLRCVEVEAEKAGVEIDYCSTETPEYEAHGCCTCKMVG